MIPTLTDPSRQDDQASQQLVVAGTLGRSYGDRGVDVEATHVPAGSGVRRLTPTECERLMSWPDGWTALDGPDTPDARRYAACGDGVVSNVAEWIGRGIMREDES